MREYRKRKKEHRAEQVRELNQIKDQVDQTKPQATEALRNTVERLLGGVANCQSKEPVSDLVKVAHYINIQTAENLMNVYGYSYDQKVAYLRRLLFWMIKLASKGRVKQFEALYKNVELMVKTLLARNDVSEEYKKTAREGMVGMQFYRDLLRKAEKKAYEQLTKEEMDALNTLYI
jgi:hypothetical protein